MKKENLEDDREFVYVFRNVCPMCRLNHEVYDSADRDRALDILNSISKEITIDKTYVDFDGTRYEKTFLTETGWNALRRLTADTKMGKKCTKTQRKLLVDAYARMLPGYYEMMFSDLGWDVSNIKFEIQDGGTGTVEITPDTVNEWKRYPGKWQTWE